MSRDSAGNPQHRRGKDNRVFVEALVYAGLGFIGVTCDHVSVCGNAAMLPAHADVFEAFCFRVLI
jgi:hypothetical protein